MGITFLSSVPFRVFRGSVFVMIFLADVIPPG